MGDLDEAIREHLELRRRRGADPGAVAREEKEVLGARRGGTAPAGDDREEDGLDRSAALDDAAAQGSGAGEDPAPLEEETAELDMQTVLDADRAEDERAGHDRAGDDLDG